MTKAHMTLSSSNSSPLADVTQAIVTTRQWRRLVERRRRERRGIILIFVVVLLMLLAIMGTAYLATSRADRLAIVKNGAVAGSPGAPRVADRTNLDTLFEAAQKRVQNALIEDLFNLPPGDLVTLQRDADKPTGNEAVTARARIFSTFRQESLSSTQAATDFNQFYYNYDAPGRADPYLSSLLPMKLPAPAGAAPAGAIVWPWIGAPLPGDLMPGAKVAPFFSDPRYLSRTATGPVTDGFSRFYARLPDASERDAEADFAAAVHNTQVTDRLNVGIAAHPMLRTDSSANVPADRKTTRVYPAFNFYAPGGFVKYIAGDADGEGIADGGMAPIMLNPQATGVNKYVDTANGVVYFMSYRVVDNSAKINVNTALTARSDFAFPNAGSVPAAAPTTYLDIRLKAAAPVGPNNGGPDQPNLGFFRNNVGLLELVRNTVDSFAPAATRDAELQRLIDARIPSLNITRVTENTAAGADSVWRRLGFDNDPANPGVPTALQVLALYSEGLRNEYTAGAPNNATDWYYRFSSFGDSLEQLLARRPDSVGSVRRAPGPPLLGGALVSLPVADTVAFSTGGGSLLNERLTPGVTENALLLSSRMTAPNFTSSPTGAWNWFPAGDVPLWFGWTKDFSMALSGAAVATTAEAAGTDYAIALLDGAAASRQYQFPPAPSADDNETRLRDQYQASFGTGNPGMDLARSIRPLITTRSGVTSSVPMRYDGQDVPPGMPGYGPMDASLAKYPAEAVSASTGTKEQLWRAYWSAMTANKWTQSSPALTVQAKKQLHDPQAASVTGKYSYYSPEVTLDPYRHAYDAFLPPERHYSIPEPGRTAVIPGGGRAQDRLKEEQMTLIRSAIAACNTVDLRDADDDITAMTVDLGQTIEYAGLDPQNPINSNNPAQRGKLYARVYGTERQLVISSVVINQDPGGNYVAVELFNPTDKPIKLDGYHLAVMNRGESTPVSLDDGYVYVDNPAASPTIIDETLMSSGAPARHDPTTDPTMILPLTARAPASIRTLAPGGFVIITNGPVAPPPNVAIPAADVPAQPALAPNDVIFADQPSATATAPQIMLGNPMPYLTRLLGRDSSGRLNCELALLRTRRADGVVYRDHDYVTTPGTPAMEFNGVYHRPTMNEDLTTVQGLSTLVPVDAVDCRSLDQLPQPVGGARPAVVPGPATAQYVYVRTTAPYQRFTPNVDAWKCFYAGRTYDPRPLRVSQKPAIGTGLVPPAAPQGVMPQIEPSAPPLTNWAWQDATVTLPAIALGTYHPSAGATATVIPFLSPTIPIQNTTPYTQYDPSYTPFTLYNPSTTAPRTDVDHAPFQFPYGSPFARNGDLLNVPFIGTYKIYRVQIDGPHSTQVGTNPPTVSFNILPPTVAALPGPAGSPPPAPPTRALYEYVPVTVDAVNVAPDPAEWTTTLAPTAYSNPSVGRFDARETIYPRNDWAADVSNYVVARKSSSQDMAFPDIPTTPASTPTTYYNNPLQPATDQDGPILSVGDAMVATGATPLPPAVGATANATPRVPWIEWRADTATGPQPRIPTSSSRSADAPLAGSGGPTSKLIQGTINLNTAPPVVLRMLPWTVDPDTGFVDQVAANTPAAARTNAIQRQRAGALTYFATSSDIDLTPPLTVADAVPQGRQARPYKYGPFGFTSVLAVSDLPFAAGNDPLRTLPLTDAASATVWSHTSNQQLMRMGMLNPQHRSDNETDFNVTHMNATRVSNLASQRSDCFTVYVTVQAWTYVPGTGTGGRPAQETETRLVGERRGSFVVDRSRISQTAYKPSDLIVYPVEQE